MNMLNDNIPSETTPDSPEVKPDHSIRNICLAVLALWVALCAPAMYVLSASPVALRLWLAFLAANLIVWPTVLIAGMVLEAAKSIKTSPMLQGFEKPELDHVVPDARLAVE